MSWSYNPRIAVTTLVWANALSLATTHAITFVFFSSAYLDVSVQRVRSPIGVMHLQCIRLPHSEICGSIRMCQSPQLIAAYHVLHRLWEPRHPPYALILLIVFFWSYLLLSKTVSFYLFVYYLNMSMNFSRICESWRISESNRWPPACKAGALASWANPPFLNSELWIQNYEFWILNF